MRTNRCFGRWFRYTSALSEMQWNNPNIRAWSFVRLRGRAFRIHWSINLVELFYFFRNGIVVWILYLLQFLNWDCILYPELFYRIHLNIGLITYPNSSPTSCSACSRAFLRSLAYLPPYNPASQQALKFAAPSLMPAPPFALTMPAAPTGFLQFLHEFHILVTPALIIRSSAQTPFPILTSSWFQL